MNFFKSLTNYAMMYLKGRCYKIMTKFTNLKHSIIGCNASTGRINSRLHQLQVAKSKKVKLPFWWTFALYQTKVRRSGRLYQTKAPIRQGTRLARARSRHTRPGPIYGRGSWSWSWERELELGGNNSI